MPLRYPEQLYQQYTLGVFAHPGDGCEAQAVLLHQSPPDQELLTVVLLEDYLCELAGKVIEIPRREFTVVCEQGDL